MRKVWKCEIAFVALLYHSQKQMNMKTKLPTLTINSLINKMYDEKLTSEQVVDKADQAFRDWYEKEVEVIHTDELGKMSCSMEGLKISLAFALEHIIALRNQLGVYEEMKYDAETADTSINDNLQINPKP